MVQTHLGGNQDKIAEYYLLFTEEDKSEDKFIVKAFLSRKLEERCLAFEGGAGKDGIEGATLMCCPKE